MWNSRRLGGESGAVNRPVARGAAAVRVLAGFLVAAEDGANRANDAAPRQEEPQPCTRVGMHARRSWRPAEAGVGAPHHERNAWSW